MPRQTGTWWILGAGSIGCLFAAYLQRAGVDLQLILRDAASLALWQRSGGIALQRDGGKELLAVPTTSATALHDSPQKLRAPIQKMLICTKAQQTLGAIAAIQAAIDPHALLVLLQNGMGVREQLAELLPHATILHALSTEGAYQNTRFHIVHAGRGETLIGALQPQQQARALNTSTELRCELAIAAVDNIDTRLWLKLAVNSVINPLTALHRCRNGELLQLAGIEPLLAELCSEASAVANAEGQRFDPQQLIDNVNAVCRITAANRSSMLQDLTQARATEIDFINGYILQRAAQHGIPCPQQQALFTAITTRERALGCS